MALKHRLKEAFFGGLWRLASTWPARIVTCGLILALIAGLAAVFFLQLDADQDSLVSPEVPFQKRYLKVLRNFGDQEYLYVVIPTGDTETGRERAREFSDALAARLRKHPELIQGIYYRLSAADLGEGALYYASPEEAGSLSDTVTALAPSLETWRRDGSLSGFLRLTASLLEGGQDRLQLADPALLGEGLPPLAGLLEGIDQTLRGSPSDAPPLPLSTQQARYFFTDNGQLLIMRLLPEKDYSSFDVIGKPLAAVRQALEETREEFPGVTAGLTGRPVLQADEMQTTNLDMTRASIIAVLVVGGLFMIVLHGWLRSALVIAALLMAMAWTFGFATVAVGKLNLLSIVFTLMLVGIGVDFGVHLVTRYVEDRKAGAGVEEAVRCALLQTGPGILLAALTSLCAFYSVLGSDFVGLAELGLIGGTGILLCLLAMLTVLPAMLLLAGKRNLFPSSAPPLVAMPFFERFLARPGQMLAGLAVLTLAALPGLFRTGFDYNLLELQARGLESVAYEKLLIEASDESTWYAVLTADNLPEARRLLDALKQRPTVGKVESIFDYVPAAQEKKAVRFARAAAALGEQPFSIAEPGPPDPVALQNALGRLESSLEKVEEKLFAAGAGEELALLGCSLDHLRSARDILAEDPGKATRLTGLQESLQTRIGDLLDQLQRWLGAEPVRPEDLPASVRDIFVGRDGRYQIKAIPAGNVWDFENLKQFVADLRQVDPQVSGVPVGVLESARLMHRTFLYAAGLTLVLVSVILWVYSRSLRYLLLTLLPLGVGMVWLLELMGWFGLNFNLANFFAIPILIAIGVDGGVHFLARWKELGGRGGLFFTSTPVAVTLSFATTMIGFGGLLLAHHRGLASLGGVMVLGSLTGMLACLLVLPATLKLFGNSLDS